MTGHRRGTGGHVGRRAAARAAERQRAAELEVAQERPPFRPPWWEYASLARVVFLAAPLAVHYREVVGTVVVQDLGERPGLVPLELSRLYAPPSRRWHAWAARAWWYVTFHRSRRRWGRVLPGASWAGWPINRRNLAQLAMLLALALSSCARPPAPVTPTDCERFKREAWAAGREPCPDARTDQRTFRSRVEAGCCCGGGLTWR